MEIASAFDRVRAYQWLAREVQPHLTPYETTAMLYLLDQSVGFGRDWVRLSTKQILEGDAMVPPLNLKRPTFFRALDRLKRIGLVSVDSPGRARVTTYTVNLEWENDMGLPTPKRKKVESHTETHESHTETKESHTETPINRKKSKREMEPAARGFSAEEIIAQAKQKKRDPKNLKELWRDAWIDGDFDTLPVLLSNKDQAILKKALSRISIEQRQDFVRHLMREWQSIRVTVFEWMSDAPRQPNVLFIARFINELVNHFSESLRQGRRADVSMHEDLYNQYRRKGMSHDEALKRLVDTMSPGTPEKTEEQKRMESVKEHNAMMEAVEAERRSNRKVEVREKVVTTPKEDEELDAVLDKIAATTFPEWEEDDG